MKHFYYLRLFIIKSCTKQPASTQDRHSAGSTTSGKWANGWPGIDYKHYLTDIQLFQQANTTDLSIRALSHHESTPRHPRIEVTPSKLTANAPGNLN